MNEKINPQRLKWIRERRRMTRMAAALRYGVNEDILAAWESGTVDVPSGYRRVIMDTLEVDLPILTKEEPLEDMVKVVKVEVTGLGPVVYYRSLGDALQHIESFVYSEDWEQFGEEGDEVKLTTEYMSSLDVEQLGEFEGY